jgi:hypothetical protein
MIVDECWARPSKRRCEDVSGQKQTRGEAQLVLGSYAWRRSRERLHQSTTMNAGTRIGVALLVLGAMSSTCASGQALYIQDFENISSPSGGLHGPPELIAEGWIFRNQSNPIGPGYWDRSAWAYQGNWALDIYQWVSTYNGANAQASSWAILPAIAGQSASDSVRFFYSSTQIPGWTPDAHLEVRYSPSGGTGTGSGPADVGDFTELIGDIPATNYPWTEAVAPLPGAGRIALRYHIPAGSSQSGFWGYFDIDNLSVGPAQAPCAQPPMPDAGQTITWTAAEGPYEICESATIPPTATVIIEAGAVIAITSEATLTVEGTLMAQGTGPAPVVISASAVFPPGIDVLGTLDMSFSHVSCQVRPEPGSASSFFDCAFTSPGVIYSDGGLYGPSYFVEVDGCTFDNAALDVNQCTLVVRNSSFDATYIRSGESFPRFENVTVNNAPFQAVILWHQYQPVYVSGLQITNGAGPGLQLSGGGDFDLGPDVVLSGNLFSVAFAEDGAGLRPDTVIPATGNTNNYVLVDSATGELRGPTTWSPVGVPYVVNDIYSLTSGTVDILPGTTVQFDVGAGFWVVGGGNLRAHGLPEAPVTFERFNPSQAWSFLALQTPGMQLRHCVVDGSEFGVAAPGINVFVESCLFTNNSLAAQASGIGHELRIHGSRFLSNGTGVRSSPETLSSGGLELDGTTNPNSFEGNGVAVDIVTPQPSVMDAENNWWNDPTGPNSANNPGGQGEVIGGNDSALDVVPFRTTAPDYSNHPPVVELLGPSSLLEPGTKVIIHWTVQDDDTIVAQRIVFSPAGDFEFPETVVAGLAGTVRAFEWTVPDIGFQVTGSPAYLRVIAVDSHGQEGWAQGGLTIPSNNQLVGDLTFTVDPGGMSFHPRDPIPVAWTSDITGGSGAVAAFFSFDGDRAGAAAANGNLADGQLYTDPEAPYVSSDSVRIALRVDGTCCNSVKWYFTGYFSIRPDPGFGDAPPTVALVTPHDGDSYAGGTVVAISWTASDDDSIRGFDVQASTDGWRTYFAVARNLPAETTSFNWTLPASTGLAGAGVRVIARDLRYQNSRSGDDRFFEILPGSGAVPGDLNCDGSVAFGDINPFVLALADPTAYGSAYPDCNVLNGDINADGSVDCADINPFVALLTGG